MKRSRRGSERYRAELSAIPMSVFIRLYAGERKGILFEGEDDDVERTVSRLVSEYNAIIGERNVRAEVMRSARRMNSLARLSAARMAVMFIECGDTETASEILCGIGCRSSGTEDMKRKAQAVVASESFSLDRERNAAVPEKSAMTSADFVRERVAMMRHYRMHIDTDEYSAEEYAYLVKGFCEEVESMRRKTDAVKRKGR